MEEIWIIGVDHGIRDAVHPTKGPIVQVCYALPNHLGMSESPVADAGLCSRERVLAWLSQHTTLNVSGRGLINVPRYLIYTATYDPSIPTWTKGAQVIPTPDGAFITTERGGGIDDNLGSLPPCASALALV